LEKSEVFALFSYFWYIFHSSAELGSFPDRKSPLSICSWATWKSANSYVILYPRLNGGMRKLASCLWQISFLPIPCREVYDLLMPLRAQSVHGWQKH